MNVAGTVALLAAALLPACPLAAQHADTILQAPDQAPTVYLMTMGPGALVWERFGHNAIWIHDPIRGTDLTYNYGLFDIRQEHFILRFIQGRMWYWMGGDPVDYYLRQYRRANRSIWIQELNLPLDARRELQAFLEWNALPKNRFYRYDYYLDNCSTRIRDVLDRVLRGGLRAQTESVAVAATYRFHTQRLTANDVPIYTGLYAILGPGADRPLSAWEEMFLPLSMREHVRRVMLPGLDGHDIPLVKAEHTVYESTAPSPPPEPPAWLWAYLLTGTVIGIGIVALGRAAGGSRGARKALAVAGVVWGLVAGLAGVVLAGVWLATDHVITYRNLNLFHLSPAVLPLAALLPAAAFGASWARRPAWIVAVIAAGFSVAGLVLQMVPGINQVNALIVALVLPIHLGMALAARTVARLE